MKIETKTKLLIILYIVSTLLIAHFAFAQSFFKGPALIEGLTSTVTAGATTTLTKDSQTNQQFTGSSNQTLVLPNATTLPLYRYFQIENRSTGTITVQTSGGGALTTVLAGTQKQVLVTNIGSAAGAWDVSAINIADVAGVLPIVNGGTALSTTPTNGQLLIGNGTNYSLATITGTTNQVNVTNGSGTITLATPQDIATTSSPTFDSLTLTNPLTMANGGTNKALTASAGSVVYSDADSFELSAVGTSNQVLISNGTAAPSWSSVSTLLDTTYFKQLGNSFGTDASLGTNDTFGVILETNGTRRMYLDDATYSVFLGNNSLTTGSSTYPLWLDNGAGQNAFIKFTSGASTGTSSSDGLDVGYLGASGAYIWNNESSPMDFGTSNTQRMQISSAGLVAIGGSAPTTSAKLDIQGTDGALLLPRLTTTQKNALTPAAGMMVYDTTLTNLSYYNGSWVSPLSNPMTTGGDLIYGGASGVPTRLANGTLNQVLTSSGGTSAPTWADNIPKSWVARGYISGSSKNMAAVGSFTEITQTDWTLTPRSSSQAMSILCDSTNSPSSPSTSPTTCPSGTESLGFSVDAPYVGWYRICISVSTQLAVGGAANDVVDATYDIFETPINAQTNTQQGFANVRMYASNNASATLTTNIITPATQCASMYISSTGQKAFRFKSIVALSGASLAIIVPDAQSVISAVEATFIGR